MNKLAKVGVSALCGSLAAISAAHAGALTIAGGATATYTELDYGDTGNPFGMASNMTFTGSGELDNGSAVTVNIAHSDQNVYSASDVSLDIPGLGKFTFDQGGGTGIDRFDDKMPTAWEEPTGTGVTTGIVTVSGVGGGADLEWALSSDFLPDGVSAYIAWSPKADGLTANDKASTGPGTTGAQAGWDVAVSHTGLADGLEVFAGYSSIDQDGVGVDDHTSKVIGATYAAGNFTVGYQYSTDDLNTGGTDMYENNMYGVSFSINDDLSVSYGRSESERSGSASDTETVIDSFQAAYSMGGATIKFAETQVDNHSYTPGTGADRGGTTLALTLAF